MTILSFPDTYRVGLFGDEHTEPTIPAPDGGWGVPNVETAGYLTFGLPTAHITPELGDWLVVHPDVLVGGW